jgi:hypothetical protein
MIQQEEGRGPFSRTGPEIALAWPILLPCRAMSWPLEHEGGVSVRQRVSGDEEREVPACRGQDAGVGQSFDNLARSLAEGSMSRRRALRLFGAAFVGTVMASIPWVAWAAPCRPGQFQCGRRCCPEVASCVRGDCVCPAGQKFCAPETLQGISSCCPEGTFCCPGTVATLCCPNGTICNRSSQDVLSCEPSV